MSYLGRDLGLVLGIVLMRALGSVRGVHGEVTFVFRRIIIIIFGFDNGLDLDMVRGVVVLAMGIALVLCLGVVIGHELVSVLGRVRGIDLVISFILGFSLIGCAHPIYISNMYTTYTICISDMHIGLAFPMCMSDLHISYSICVSEKYSIV